MATLNEIGKSLKTRLEQAESSGALNEKGKAMLTRLRQVPDVAQESTEKEFEASFLLPAAGAAATVLAAGSGVGLPVAAGLAALGGAGGKGYQQLIARFRGKKVPKTSLEAAKELGLEGVKQAAFEAGGGILGKTIAKGASEAAGQALGFTKRFITNPKKLRAVKQASKTMLEEGIVTPLAGTQKMIQRVTDVKKKTGEGISEFLQKQGIGFDPKLAIQEIETLRPKIGPVEPGQSLGHLDDINRIIDKSIDTIKAYGSQPLSFEQANKIKGLLQDVTDFTSTKSNKELGQAIAGKFKSVLDDTLERVSSAKGDIKGFSKFLRDKKVYQAASKAEEGLYNRLSSEVGNKAISLTDWLALIGGAGVGGTIGGGFESIVGLGSSYLVKKLGEKFGPQTAAVLGHQLSKNPRLLSNLARLADVGIREFIEAGTSRKNGNE